MTIGQCWKSSIIAMQWAIALTASADATAQWETVEWVARCLPLDDGGDAGCSADSPFSSDVLGQLNSSSEWLQGFGYRQPTIVRIPMDVNPERPWVALIGGVDACRTPQVRPGDLPMAACYQVDQVFKELGWLAPAQYKSSGEPIPGLGVPTIRIGTDVRDRPLRNASAPTHELFHGVQASYGLNTLTTGWLWFVESTAASVEEEHYAQHFGAKYGIEIDQYNRVLVAGRPYYDYPLDELPNPMIPGLKEYAAYLVWSFIGNTLGAGDTVMGLRMLFDALDVQGEPIAQIDAALKKLGRGGLSVHYPEYIAKRAERPFDFETQAAPLKVFDGSEKDRTDETEGTVNRLAAQFHLVTADPKQAEHAKLEIRLEGEDSLHLIVNDTRYDGGTGSRGSEKNVFRARLEDPKTFTIRVANVAQDAAYTSQQNYTLKARLLTEPADCCSCAFDSTEVFASTGDFQCSFAYPAGWEVSYDRWENSVYVTAPRCEKRCGSRSMSVSIGTGKDNNWEVREKGMQETLQSVGKGSCGGRAFRFYRSMDSKPDKLMGALNFYVGKNDNKAYGALATFQCPEPGDWRELERLLIDSLK